MSKYNKAIARNQARGYLFELVIRHLLAENGFTQVRVCNERGGYIDAERIKEDKSRFIELKGRGAWHQIDCPFDYDFTSPFMYPIRLIGEVKYHKNVINKQYIREFIGVLKDIQENYFVPPDLAKDDVSIERLPCRYLEVGTFFSAEGFNQSAELLAYAHGIKTISYKNNYLVADIKKTIDEFEEKSKLFGN